MITKHQWDGAYWPRCKVVINSRCSPPQKLLRLHTPFKIFCCHNRFSPFLSVLVSPDFSPSPVAHRPGEYLFVHNQELIFLPLFVLYHYTQIASILHLQPAAGACEECCNLLFACCWLWSVFLLSASGWFKTRDFTEEFTFRGGSSLSTRPRIKQ